MPRPLFLLLTYQQEHFVDAAVRSALAQTGGPLDILISDDCSQDGTWDAITSLVDTYEGPHRIHLNRNKTNLGLIPHLNKCFESTDAKHIIVAAGDDISHPDRAKIVLDTFAKTNAQLVHSDIDPIDQNGKPTDYPIRGLLNRKTSPQRAAISLGLYIGATGAWDRNLFDKYGPLPDGIYEDLIFGFRAALEGKIAYIDKPLVQYRADSGMSAPPDQSVSKEDWLKKRSSALERGIRTYRQRLEDTKLSGVHNRLKIEKILQAKIREYEARQSVLGLTKRQFFASHFCIRPLYIQAWFSERKREIRRR